MKTPSEMIDLGNDLSEIADLVEAKRRKHFPRRPSDLLDRDLDGCFAEIQSFVRARMTQVCRMLDNELQREARSTRG